MPHYVYILRCRDGSLYTGYSTDPERRLKEHQEGKGARYTRGRRPVELLGFLEFQSRSEALSAEATIKRYSPQKKLAILRQGPMAGRSAQDVAHEDGVILVDTGGRVIGGNAVASSLTGGQTEELY